jgi:hypothetical protein
MSSLRVCCLALVSFALVACDPGTGGAPDLSPTPRCSAGATKGCLCLGGGEGQQTCRSDERGWGSCQGCAGAPDGPVRTLNDSGSSTCGECDGCCDGTTCIHLSQETNTQCGVRGQACDTCGSKICDPDSGTCLAATGGCTPQNCPNGCCKALAGQSTCQINEPTACGTGGASCTACPGGVTCTGACTNQIAPSYKFQVYVKSVEFADHDPGGSCWDDFLGAGCGAPDPEVCFGFLSGNDVIEGCTTVITDASTVSSPGYLSASWDDSTGLVKAGGQPLLIDSSLFLAGGKVRVSVYDEDDFNANDIIGQGYYTAVSTLSVPMLVGAFDSVKSVTFELR